MPSPWWRCIWGDEDAFRLHASVRAPPKSGKLVRNHQANLLTYLDALYSVPTQLRRDRSAVTQEKRCLIIQINAWNIFDARIEWQEQLRESSLKRRLSDGRHWVCLRDVERTRTNPPQCNQVSTTPHCRAKIPGDRTNIRP
jgi:hypothetical protein